MKGRGKKINYAEVESDEDLDDQQKQLERIKREENGKKKGGDTYGTTQGGQRKKRKTTCNSKQLGGAGSESEYNSKLLLDLPFDLFFEVCSHFDGKDLLKLAQVNKAIRGVLLSKEAHSVWSALRRKLGYALPTGMEEVEFALIVHSEKCQVCERPVRNKKSNAFLRSRLCYECLRSHTISSKGLKKAWPDLHHFATDCVRYVDQGNRWGNRSDEPRPYRYLVSDLQAVDYELKELEEEDEIALSLLENLHSKGSSTRSRHSTGAVKEVNVDGVERYVKDKQGWVKVEQKASKKHCKNLARLEKEQEDEARARRQSIRDSQVATAKTLKDDYDWEDDEIDYLLSWRGFGKLAPKATIEEKPNAWSKCRQVIRTRLDEEATRQAQNARQALLRPYYESFEVQEKNQRDVFPHFVVFLKFKSILPLWESEDATIDDEIWQEVQRNVSKDLDKWEEGYRVETIRLILAANQGLDSTSSLSNDPADYPESTYDNAFFSRMTSLFCTRGWSRAHGRGLRVESYPSVAQGNPSWGSHQLQSRITPRHIMIIRSLLEAAGLDPEISTYDDLEELEPSFVWVNDPRPTYRRRRFHRYWLHLLSDALRKGPSKQKIAKGECFEFEYCPQDEDQGQNSEGLSSDEEDEEEENEEEEGSGNEGGESGGEDEENGSENDDDNLDDEA